MESFGAIFLPVSGTQQAYMANGYANPIVDQVNTVGYYWSNSKTDDYGVYHVPCGACVYFNKETMTMRVSNMYTASTVAVRLAKDIKKTR